MRDKYKHNKTKHQNKKTKVCGQDSCPTWALTLHNTERSHNCHLSQHRTPTQLSLGLHSTGHPYSHGASESPTTQEGCGWGGGIAHHFGSSTPAPQPQQKKKSSTVGERKAQAVQSTGFFIFSHIHNHLGTSYWKRQLFTDTHECSSLASTCGGELTSHKVTHGARLSPRATGKEPCRRQPCSLWLMQEKANLADQSPCQAAQPQQIKSEVPTITALRFFH